MIAIEIRAGMRSAGVPSPGVLQVLLRLQQLGFYRELRPLARCAAIVRLCRNHP